MGNQTSRPTVLTMKDDKDQSLLSLVYGTNKYKKLYEQMMKIPEKEPIDIIITTNGGAAIWCFKICEVIKNRSGKVRIFVKHFSHSSGSIIALAGDELYMNFSSNLSAIDPQMNLKHSLSWIPVKDISKIVKNTVSETLSEFPNLVNNHYEKENEYHISTIKDYINQTDEITETIIQKMYKDPVNHGVLFFKRHLVDMGIEVKDWDGKIIPSNTEPDLEDNDEIEEQS